MSAVPKVGITRRSFLQGSTFALGLAWVGRFLTARVPERLASWGIPTPWYRQGAIVETYTVCDMCPWRCGIIVQTVGGRVHKIDGNPADPKSRGKLCARGQGGVSFLNDPGSPQDATHPHRVSEAAVSSVRRRGKRHSTTSPQEWRRSAHEVGPESIAFLGHTSGDGWFVDHLAQAWGSPNAARPSSSICTSPREEAALLTSAGSSAATSLSIGTRSRRLR